MAPNSLIAERVTVRSLVWAPDRDERNWTERTSFIRQRLSWSWRVRIGSNCVTNAVLERVTMKLNTRRMGLHLSLGADGVVIGFNRPNLAKTNKTWSGCMEAVPASTEAVETCYVAHRARRTGAIASRDWKEQMITPHGFLDGPRANILSGGLSVKKSECWGIQTTDGEYGR